jgi:hypothetical protein
MVFHLNKLKARIYSNEKLNRESMIPAGKCSKPILNGSFSEKDFFSEKS